MSNWFINDSEWKIIKKSVDGYLCEFVIENLNGEQRSVVGVDNYYWDMNSKIDFLAEVAKDSFTTESERFYREINTFCETVSKPHPNILNFYQWHDNNGCKMAILENFEGISIVEALHNLDETLFMSYFRQLYEAVYYLHSHKMYVVCWDPNKIIVNLKKGIVKITNIWDFRTVEQIKNGGIKNHNCYFAHKEIYGQTNFIRADLVPLSWLMYDSTFGNSNRFRHRDIHYRIYSILDRLRVMNPHLFSEQDTTRALNKEKTQTNQETSNDVCDEKNAINLVDRIYHSLLKLLPDNDFLTELKDADSEAERSPQIDCKIFSNFNSAKEALEYIDSKWPSCAKMTPKI